MKIAYIDRRFSASARKKIDQANAIIEEFRAQGFELTLRQLYYQFVARDLIPNTQREYKNLGAVINDGRLAGEISWEAIVDRTRNLESNSHWDNPGEILDSCVRSYATDKWKNQQHRIEVWIEKDALVGVIERVCKELDVPFFSCRGYTSQSEMHSAAMRMVDYWGEGFTPVIIHLGDHDPSGKDMSRDIEDRMNLFMGESAGLALEFNRIALNMDQVRKFKPPPNPAKITDPRAKGYVREFGQNSWELDALDPKILDQLIRSKVLSYRDDELWDEAVEQQESDRDRLSKAAKRIKKEK